jgi:UDP-N-acetylmuramoylalanine--D-glutamate ligase
MQNWSGRRVLILGAARQGMALARWLIQHGAIVTLSDVRAADSLSETTAALSGLSIRWALGGHPLDLLDTTDVICLSGGVSPSIPIVEEAARRGIPITNDTQIFMEAVPCRTVGITGSAGKTTTTALVGEMAQAAFEHDPGDVEPGATAAPRARAYVGGNIGDPLLNHLEAMRPSDLAIMEISSFQLEQMTLSPTVAAVLNITPNHLDRHRSMEAYTAAKVRILDFQRAHDKAVLGRDDPGTWNLRSRVKGEMYTFGFGSMGPQGDGTYYDDGLLYLRDQGMQIPLLRREQIPLRGDHNVLNVLGAFAIGHAAGLPLDAMLMAAQNFEGVPHRLELVRVLRGSHWYDDSIATTPERVVAAIRSFDEPLVLLLGGRDKDLPWEDLATLVCRRVDHVVLFGEASGKIEKALTASRVGGSASEKRLGSLEIVPNLRQAVREAHRVAQEGDVVLLSPGGTSFDEFKDFEERGARFRAWVQELS